MLSLLDGALALDTGSVCDIGATDFNMSVDIILYVTRLCARVDNYCSFIVSPTNRTRDAVLAEMRDSQMSVDNLETLEASRLTLQRRLHNDLDALLNDYLAKLDEQTAKEPLNEKLIRWGLGLWLPCILRAVAHAVRCTRCAQCRCAVHVLCAVHVTCCVLCAVYVLSAVCCACAVCCAVCCAVLVAHVPQSELEALVRSERTPAVALP